MNETKDKIRVKVEKKMIQFRTQSNRFRSIRLERESKIL